jgi:hypothetical protein
MHPANDAATLGACQSWRDTTDVTAVANTLFQFFTLPFRTFR